MLSIPSAVSTALTETSLNSLGAVLKIASPQQTFVYSATRSLANCFVQAAISEGLKAGLTEQTLGDIAAYTSDLGITTETASKVIEYASKVLGYLVSAKIGITIANTACTPKDWQDEVVYSEITDPVNGSAANDPKMGWTKAFLLDACGAGAQQVIQNAYLLG